MFKKKTQLSTPTLPELQERFVVFPWLNRRGASIIIFILGVLLYAPSYDNEYALDDGIIIHQNDHVMKGVRGIKDIITKDAYESFYRRMCATDQLAGGRYRPLSAVSFAIEQEVLGAYRSGLYTQVADLNGNGMLDHGKVKHLTPCGRQEENYEYNESVDANLNGMTEPKECPACWDKNKNFVSDREEDLNNDGIHNEIDCQLYGASFRHINNIWMYALACVLLYQVFSTCFFRSNQDLAFLAAILFCAHPIHSEAVANVKSRDEIMSLMFVALTFQYAFRFLETKRFRDLTVSSLSLLLALLSKEYAVMMLALVPLSLYCFTDHNFSLAKFRQTDFYRPTLIVAIGFVTGAVLMTYIKRDFDIHALPGAKPIRSFWLIVPLYLAVLLVSGVFRKKSALSLFASHALVLLIYVGMRWLAVKLKPGVPDTEILNNPYLLADGEERFCTKGFVLLKYIWLLIFPHPLVSDYSFNTIQYRTFSSWDFWASVVVHAALIVTGIRLLLRKHVLGFAIAVYLCFLLLVANVLMDIGATMGERLVFHASIGFCIALAWLVVQAVHRLRSARAAILSAQALLITVVLLFGVKAWERCLDWKSDITLFLKDVQTHPNSVLCLGNAGARYVDLLNTEDFAPKPKPGYDSAFNDHNGTLSHLVEDVAAGKFASVREAGIHHGIGVLTHAIELHPRYVNGYLNLGLLYFQLRKDFEALYYLKNAERLYPNNPYLRSYYGAYSADLKQRAASAINRNRWDSATVAYNLLTILEPHNPEAWYMAGGGFFNTGRFAKARRCWSRALTLKPDYREVRQVMQMLPPDPSAQVVR